MSDWKEDEDAVVGGIAVVNRIDAVGFGVIDANFLCESVSRLKPGELLAVGEEESVDLVMHKLKEHRSGCAVIVDGGGRLAGIFSERDYILRVYGSGIDPVVTPISACMTRDPVSQAPDASVGHVLNLMSNGGFRHIPIVDQDNVPMWMLSVKSIIDHLVGSVSEALLGFPIDCGDDKN